MFTKFGTGVLIVLALLSVVVAARPAAFRIERSTIIAAPAALIFERIDDFHRWVEWSPYETLDPNLQRSYAGAPSGIGAVYGWSGNTKTGEGRMTITESEPGRRVALQLEFLKPFPATNEGAFTFKPVLGGVLVTWSMAGRNGFVSRAFAMLVNIDKVVGSEFEKGLATLKRLSESEARSPAGAKAGATIVAASTGR